MIECFAFNSSNLIPGASTQVKLLPIFFRPTAPNIQKKYLLRITPCRGANIIMISLTLELEIMQV